MPPRKPDIGFIPTPLDMVNAMLALAEVTANDILYDLGSGDGRVVIAAAQQFGTCGVGIDIDPTRIVEATEQAHWAGVGDRVTFRLEDLFESDFNDATVVVLYLLPHLNLKLRPHLFRQLKPGTRIISRDFDMDTWKPDRTVSVHADEEDALLYYWVIPETMPAL
ncbi:class I SAM-dependent methyltransferase [Oculatella sp. LEGE 06141]|nr:class I SAM-dependent methyltransferase [Oculatella sp. LEGE 06141]